MDLYARSLQQFQLKQAIQVLENRLFRLRNEKLRLQDHIALIEQTKEEEFIKKGFRKVKADKTNEVKK